jgi:hypothetical protein
MFATPCPGAVFFEHAELILKAKERSNGDLMANLG